MSYDEQPDGDPHGECAVEIHALKKELNIRTAQRDEAVHVRRCMVAELTTSLRSCEKQLVTCAHAYRAADNFDEAQRCSDIAFTARLILQKWEEKP